MKKLYVMCGGPGSGKSTWIKKNLPTFKGYTKVVSRDEIRFSLVKEGEEYFSKEMFSLSARHSCSRRRWTGGFDLVGILFKFDLLI